ncbi:pyocin knob domain-containing protein [Paenibacillus thiaminolyticus]|uniref:Pyocin knob domain-containing protein n=1 Tax=Paenibacillus thiaminolyticus TaxID=49283 RepID=A0ABT4FYQ9_PANTH|nr:pyocin knob domain-containing protein [Paenibacillus thiaminolyticus]MCY9537726.1 pyocin knob domain-containing protein [Paenibacillus thiaminolyticus]MCY9600283.1 pyocin knob domain-containing protein [Paenibacillus thiaminolyticus]MCY9607843.1 pyocin knob domain-containing protein [Paenibacillus thiaminolyticus]MCY9613870.1 pyocin knob domain-containing protein [Paenibacillus thiaminolyticus]MCY9617875.1 pyocin knob domain-containing protein [Paenibacillus thiaminolyticus]
MAFQKPLPEWKQPGIRPPDSKIKEGYQVLDKPPAAWMNWQMNTTYEALQELQEKAAEKEDISQALGEAKAYADEKVADIDLTQISPESIGAAKKADLDAHAADTVKHITVAERAAWNQAETNAKSYIDAKPWQRHKVSGDDGAAIDITNRDLNSIVHTGFYRGTNLGNAPALLHGWGYVEVITHAPGSWVLQKVYDLHADRFYMRRLTDSGWTAWTQDLFQSGVDAKTRIAGAISAKGVPASANDTWPTLETKIRQIYTGLPVARINVTTSYSNPSFNQTETSGFWAYFVVVTGLGFRAKRIEVHISSHTFPSAVYDAYRTSGKIWTNAVSYGSYGESFLVTEADTLPDTSQNSNRLKGTITPDGFLMPVATDEDYAGKAVYIVAIG